MTAKMGNFAHFDRKTRFSGENGKQFFCGSSSLRLRGSGVQNLLPNANLGQTCIGLRFSPILAGAPPRARLVARIGGRPLHFAAQSKHFLQKCLLFAQNATGVRNRKSQVFLDLVHSLKFRPVLAGAPPRARLVARTGGALCSLLLRVSTSCRSAYSSHKLQPR